MTSVSRRLRNQVRERAEGRCEYCHNLEAAEAFSFHVEHILPRKHDGESTLDNLAWACMDCNYFKGTDVAGYDQETGRLVQLFNPRLQRWNDHFALDGVHIVGKTAIGRVTVRLLRFNEPDRIEGRAELIDVGLW